MRANEPQVLREEKAMQSADPGEVQVLSDVKQIPEEEKVMQSAEQSLMELVRAFAKDPKNSQLEEQLNTGIKKFKKELVQTAEAKGNPQASKLEPASSLTPKNSSNKKSNEEKEEEKKKRKEEEDEKKKQKENEKKKQNNKSTENDNEIAVKFKDTHWLFVVAVEKVIKNQKAEPKPEKEKSETEEKKDAKGAAKLPELKPNSEKTKEQESALDENLNADNDDEADQDYYELLGIDDPENPGSESEIAEKFGKAYLAAGSDEGQKDKIMSAFKTLSDPEKRESYKATMKETAKELAIEGVKHAALGM